MSSDTRPEEDDATLVCRIAANEDQRALDELVRRYAPKATGFLKKQFTGQLQDLEIDQAVNNAFFNVWRFADKFKPEKRSFKTWFMRILMNAALSILRGDKGHLEKELEFDPAYDPADHCPDESPAAGSKDEWRIQQMEDIIENVLKGFEQAVARADLRVGGSADSKRLAAIHRKSLNMVYVTRKKVRNKIKNLILERETRKDQQKGTK